MISLLHATSQCVVLPLDLWGVTGQLCAHNELSRTWFEQSSVVRNVTRQHKPLQVQGVVDSQVREPDPVAVASPQHQGCRGYCGQEQVADLRSSEHARSVIAYAADSTFISTVPRGVRLVSLQELQRHTRYRAGRSLSSSMRPCRPRHAGIAKRYSPLLARTSLLTRASTRSLQRWRTSCSLSGWVAEGIGWAAEDAG